MSKSTEWVNLHATRDEVRAFNNLLARTPLYGEDCALLAGMAARNKNLETERAWNIPVPAYLLPVFLSLGVVCGAEVADFLKTRTELNKRIYATVDTSRPAAAVAKTGAAPSPGGTR